MRLNRTDRPYSRYAQRALDYARRVAKTNNLSSIDASHLLLGILREESSVGCGVLHGLGLTLESAEAHWLAIDAADTALRERAANAQVNTSSDLLSMSPALTEALSLAADKSRWLGHAYVGTEHVLLGICRVGEAQLLRLLQRSAVDPDQVRRDIRRLLRAGVTEISIEQMRRLARLSELSRRVLNAAEQITEQTHHKQVGIMHLLLVLAREQRSVCSRILEASGFNDRALEADLYKPRSTTGGGLETLLDRAVAYANSVGSHYTGTEHLLLALSRDSRGARLLRKYGATPDEIERRVREHLSA